MIGSSPPGSDVETECKVRLVGFGNSAGWFHNSWGDTAVLICPGVGRDASKAYGTLRLLASELANIGYPTLRFDYPGTGNAPDKEGQVDPTAWLESIDAACDWLRRIGARHLILCGYRLGGVLAATAAARREDVRAVMLLDPVAAGYAYLRELRIASQLSTSNAPEQGSPAAALEIDGLLWPDSAQAMLKRLTLLSSAAKPAQPILLLGSHAATAKLSDQLRTLGAEVTQGSFTAPNEHDSDGYIRPSGLIGAMREWLDATAPQIALEGRCRTPDDPVISTASFAETSITFGPGRRLVGVLCQPKVPTSSDFILLISNMGGFHVRLARMLAGAGVTSFRFDFLGTGESEPGIDGFTHVYQTDRCPDTVAAIDAVGCLGYRRFGVAGLCSGAYHAWRASVIDKRIGTVVLINPPTFSWRKEQDFARFVSNNGKSTKFYLNSMAHGSVWRRLMRGELDVRRAARTVRTHMLRHLKVFGDRTMATIGWPTAETRLRHAMHGLNSRGVRVLFLLGSADFGVDVVRAHFGRIRVPGKLELLADTDHMISRHAMREKAAHAVLAFLRDESSEESSVQVGRSRIQDAQAARKPTFGREPHADNANCAT